MHTLKHTHTHTGALYLFLNFPFSVAQQHTYPDSITFTYTSTVSMLLTPPLKVSLTLERKSHGTLKLWSGTIMNSDPLGRSVPGCPELVSWITAVLLLTFPAEGRPEVNSNRKY